MSASYDKKIFAENLRRLMEENHSRQSDIARLLGVSRSTVSAYCAGEQMPRMDKIEQLSRHFGVNYASLIELVGDAAPGLPQTGTQPTHDLHPAVETYESLNPSGQQEFIRYGKALAADPAYKRADAPIVYIKHYLVPAAAGYASPIEGEDYELIPRPQDAPERADFCISIAGDSMAPYIPDGSLVYVRRDSPLQEFDVGVFFVDGDVYCKQWCSDYSGTLHLLSANPHRQDANISIPRGAGRNCVCFGKVILPHKLPKPIYL